MMSQTTTRWRNRLRHLLGRTPPIPPESLHDGVGGGDYLHQGEWALQVLEQCVELDASSRVVEIGYGLGQLAWFLSRRRPQPASYRGVDVNADYHRWCEAMLGLGGRYRFARLDAANGMYNPEGQAQLGLDLPDDSADVVVATSVFTHLLPDDVTRYLDEIRRVLSSRGRFVASWYLLDSSNRGRIEGATDPAFVHRTTTGGVADVEHAEEAIAFERTWLEKAAADRGLQIERVERGMWVEGHEALYYQDLVVMALASGSEDEP